MTAKFIEFMLTVAKALGIIALVAFALFLKLGSFAFGIWIYEAAPLWLRVPMVLFGLCAWIVQLFAWFERKPEAP